MSLTADTLDLLRHPRPEMSSLRHIKMCVRYLLLALRSGSLDDIKVHEPNTTVSLEQGQIWEYFTNELRYTTTHMHPRDYLKSPVVSATTAKPSILPDMRATPATGADEAIRIVTNVLAMAYPKTKLGQWENLASKSFATMENLFAQAKLDPTMTAQMRTVELGAGFGTLSFVNAQNAKHGHNNINYDLLQMSKLQQGVVQYLKLVSSDPTFLDNIEYVSDSEQLLEAVGDDDFGIQTFYAFTEFSEAEREKQLELFRKSKYAVIGSNNNFEGIDNFSYIESLAGRVNKKVYSAPVVNPAGLNWHKNHKAFLMV